MTAFADDEYDEDDFDLDDEEGDIERARERGVHYPHIKVQLTGTDGNAGAIMGQVTRAMRRDPEARNHIDEFRTECMSGDYDNLLATCMKWVDVD